MALRKCIADEMGPDDRPTIASHQSYANMGIRQPRGLHGDHEIAEKGYGAAESDDIAVEAANHRLLAIEKAVDNTFGIHEGVQENIGPVDLFAHPVPVTTGGEGPSRTGKDHDIDVIVHSRVDEDRGQFMVQLLVDRVQLIRTVQGDPKYIFCTLDAEHAIF